MADLMGGLSVGGNNGGAADLTGGGGGGVASRAGSKPLKSLLSADKGGGMSINGVVNRRGGRVFYDLEFRNESASPLAGIAIQFNKNFVGLTNAAPLQVTLYR